MSVRPITENPRPLKKSKMENEGLLAHFPKELLLSIFSHRKRASFRSLSNVKYLSHLALVCKRWNQLIPDVTLNLLNNNLIQICEIPFLHKTSLHQPYKLGDHTLLFFKYLFQEISQEKLYRQVFQRDEEDRNETFMERKLIHLNARDIRYVSDTELAKLGGFYLNITSINMDIYSARNPLFLVNFTNLKALKLPASMYDETFYKNLTQIKKLSIVFSIKYQDIYETLPLHFCTSLRSLKLDCSYPDPFTLNKKHLFPHFLKRIQIKNLKIASNMFDECTRLQKLTLKFVIFHNPTPFQNLKNLKHLSIHYHSQSKEFTSENLKSLDSTVVKAIAI